jgi:hypothetical protein
MSVRGSRRAVPRSSSKHEGVEGKQHFRVGIELVELHDKQGDGLASLDVEPVNLFARTQGDRSSGTDKSEAVTDIMIIHIHTTVPRCARPRPEAICSPLTGAPFRRTIKHQTNNFRHID